jgi:hypothetical protein
MILLAVVKTLTKLRFSGSAQLAKTVSRRATIQTLGRFSFGSSRFIPTGGVDNEKGGDQSRFKP